MALPPFPPSRFARLRHRDLIIRAGWVDTKARCARCGRVRILATAHFNPDDDAVRKQWSDAGFKLPDPRVCARCRKREEN